MSEKVIEIDELGRIWFDDYVMIDGEMWFPATNYNGLFKVEGQTAKLVVEFDKYSNQKFRLFMSCMVAGKKIILVPSYATDIVIYDIDNNTLTEIPIDIENVKISGALFISSFEYGGNFYFIGAAYPGIVRFNPDNGIEEIIEGPYLRYKEKEGGGAYYRHAYVLVENKLYLPALRENVLVSLNLDSREVSYIEVLPKGSCAWDCILDGEDIWIWGVDFCLTQYNISTHKVECYCLNKDGRTNAGSYLEKVNKKIFIYNAQRPEVIIWDSVRKEVSKIVNYEEHMDEVQGVNYGFMIKGITLLGACMINKKRYYFNSISREYIYMDTNEKICKYKKFVVDGNWIYKKVLECYNYDESEIGKAFSRKDMGLKLFLYYLKTLDLC